MKLLNLVKNLFESVAADQAHEMGLRYKGRGYWMDQSGKTVAQTVNGKLVKVDGEQETPAEPESPTPTETTPQAAETSPETLSVEPTQPDSTKLTAAQIMDTYEGGQAGSNDGAFYKGSDGQERYVKFYKDPSRAHAEVLACEIYRDLGIGAPVTQTFNDVASTGVGKDKIGFASNIIDGEILQSVGLNKKIADKILDGFAADVLVSNWDAIGLEDDNILLDKDGNPYRIDNGGCFMFRAMEMSGRKPDDVLNQISEWDAFQTKNPSYAKVWSASSNKGPTSLGMGGKIQMQIGKINQLQHQHGGWANYVEAKVPDMNPSDKAICIQMLESRTKLLNQQADMVQGIMDDKLY